MDLHIEYDNKQSLEAIQSKFRHILTDLEINQATSMALNVTARRATSFIAKQAKERYALDKSEEKKLKSMAFISKKSTPTSLYVDVVFKSKPLPFIDFKDDGILNSNGTSNNNITVEVVKGKSIVTRHAFIAKMKSGHIGIFTHGTTKKAKGITYTKGERTKKGNYKIAEMKSVSFLSMHLERSIAMATTKKINKDLPERLDAMLRLKVKKVAAFK